MHAIFNTCYNCCLYTIDQCECFDGSTRCVAAQVLNYKVKSCSAAFMCVNNSITIELNKCRLHIKVCTIAL